MGVSYRQSLGGRQSSSYLWRQQRNYEGIDPEALLQALLQEVILSRCNGTNQLFNAIS